MHNLPKWSSARFLKWSDHFGDIMHKKVYISLTEDFIQLSYLTLYFTIHNSSNLDMGLVKLAFGVSKLTN